MKIGMKDLSVLFCVLLLICTVAAQNRSRHQCPDPQAEQIPLGLRYKVSLESASLDPSKPLVYS